jgi:hypothetical protein
LGEIRRDFKIYTSKELVKQIGANPGDSRRENPFRAGLVNDETAYMWSSTDPHLGFECDEA